MWATGSDELVDGRKLLRRLEDGREPEVTVVWKKTVEEYEHLDIIWATEARGGVGEVSGVLRCIGDVPIGSGLVGLVATWLGMNEYLIPSISGDL